MNWSNKNTAAFIFFILFLVSSLIEIGLCFAQKEKARKIAKPFPMVFLIVLIIIMVPTQWELYCGAIFGLIGDLFLLSDNKKLFYTGAFAFFIGHMFYFSEILIISITAQVPFWVYFIFVGVFIALCFLLYKKMLPKIHHGVLVVMAILYFFSLIMNTTLSFIVSGYSNALPMLLTAFGNLIFLFSDTMVFKGRLVKKEKFDQMAIMPTYLAAQIMIAAGIILTFYQFGY